MTEKKKKLYKKKSSGIWLSDSLSGAGFTFIYFTGDFNCCNGFYRFRQCIYLGVCRAEEFQENFRDPNTIIIIRNTVLYVAITIGITICLQLFLATMTTYFIRDEKKGNFFKALMMIPMITPTVVYSVLWIWLLDASENGVVNQLLNRFTGLGPVNWIAEYPFQVVIFAQVLTSVAYGMTIYSSAIKSIPENQFRAAGRWGRRMGNF